MFELDKLEKWLGKIWAFKSFNFFFRNIFCDRMSSYWDKSFFIFGLRSRLVAEIDVLKMWDYHICNVLTEVVWTKILRISLKINCRPIKYVANDDILNQINSIFIFGLKLECRISFSLIIIMSQFYVYISIVPE